MKWIEHIFHGYVRKEEELRLHDFVLYDDIYRKTFSLLDSFDMVVSVSSKEVTVQVFDSATKEEYFPFYLEEIKGSYVHMVKEAAEKILTMVREECFARKVFSTKESARILSMMEEMYGITPDYLFQKYPSYAVFKKKDKWFAVLMRLDGEKLGLSKGEIEILNLKDTPEKIEEYLKEPFTKEAYHMNKKHWYTLLLKGEMEEEVLKGRIERSYLSLKKK